jgi:hypothetical protein
VTLRRAWLLAACLLYLLLAAHQLGLPGLHYDEAREAGVNAMELLTGAPVTAFRGAGFVIGARAFPLMVQDYIGALNVYLALPLLGLTGIGVPNLRLLPLLTGLAALLTLERVLAAWIVYRRGGFRAGGAAALPTPPITVAGLIAVTILAVSPSFIFWARQGVFVTNLMLPLTFVAAWQALRWLHTGRTRHLLVAAFAAGLALYAKLLAIWAIAPLLVLVGGWWLWQQRPHPSPPQGGEGTAPPPSGGRLGGGAVLGALALFLLALTPLILFNVQTGGTLAALGANAQQSYYGVDNADLAANLPVRWGQVLQVLRGEQFWYLGALLANPLAPWLALVLVLAGLLRDWRLLLAPLLLTLGVFAASLFTISDLFVTHYVLLQPLLVTLAALGAAAWLEEPPVRAGLTRRGVSAMTPVLAGLLAIWFVIDLGNTLGYHRALAQSGGLADHSDAGYHLAYHLQFNGMGSPIALDWGMDATVRFLSQGTVTPIEIFGYASPAAPDADFAARLAPFLENPANTYLLRAPDATVFQGRREAFLAAVAAAGRTPVLEKSFTQRDGAPLYEIWRVALQE